MKKLAIAALLLAGTMMGQISVGIQIGPPPRPRVMRVQPVSPGPGYVWIDGYWYAERGKWRWHQGYWTLAPYPGARWVAPRYDGGQFFAGFWDEGGRRFDHNHRWDRDRNRDRDRDRDHDRH